MKNYKLSIIIPTFNLENTIDNAFNSIKCQSIGFEDIEVIFVDDNSTDNTLSKLEDFSKKYENVNVYTTSKNSGYAGAPRNIGLEKATSDYVLFLDGDDELLVNACEVLYEKIQFYNTDIVIGGHINVYSNGIFEHYPPLLHNNESFFKNVLNPQLLNINPAISAKLFNRHLLTSNSINFPEGIPGEDLVFLLESLLNSRNALTLNNFYTYFRNLGDESVTLKLTNEYFYGLIKAYLIASDLFEKHGVDDNIQEIVFHNHLSFFTERVMSEYYCEDCNDAELSEIFSSELFDELSGKEIFKNNPNFSQYFERMKNGEYNNRDLLNNIYQTFNFDSEIISDLKYVKNEISKLNIQPNRIQEDNIHLKKVNKELSEENERLTSELNEIKSSKLWKLKNKF